MNPKIGLLRMTVAALSTLTLAAPGCTHADPPPARAGSPRPVAASGTTREGAARTVAKGAGSASPYAGRWWRDAVFYEVFVRSFADSDGDGVGDVAGLTARLDYLNDGDPATDQDLGVNALWLMPIHPSPSYHGYDVTDYRAVNPDYGTLEDLDRLLAEAHARGMRVILDFVLNHSSSQHPWFEASARGEAPYTDYYVWRDTPDERYRRPWDGASVWHERAGRHYLGLFWGGMPDLNLESDAVLDEMTDAMRFWLARGVDGFRVDAVRHLIEEERAGAVKMTDSDASHAVIKRLRARLESEFPEVLLIAEAWSSSQDIARYYGAGDEFPLAFSFGVAAGLRESLRDGQRVHLAQALAQAEAAFVDRGFEAPFLTNHDMPRIARQLDADPASLRLAAATLLALPGTPFLYYGEELGMLGGEGGADENKRTPMRWTEEGPGYGFTEGPRLWFAAPEAPSTSVAAQAPQDDSLLSWYRRLLAVRRSEPALSLGRARVLPTRGGGRGAFALLREHDGRSVLLLANFHDETAPPFEVDLGGASSAPRTLLESGLLGALAAEGGSLRVTGLGPRGFAYVQLAD